MVLSHQVNMFYFDCITIGVMEMNRSEIVARVGATSWKQVKNEFLGKSLRDITSEMYYMWPHAGRKNNTLAEEIHKEVNKTIEGYREILNREIANIVNDESNW